MAANNEVDQWLVLLVPPLDGRDVFRVPPPSLPSRIPTMSRVSSLGTKTREGGRPRCHEPRHGFFEKIGLAEPIGAEPPSPPAQGPPTLSALLGH